jgi:hypothetical protein
VKLFYDVQLQCNHAAMHNRLHLTCEDVSAGTVTDKQRDNVQTAMLLAQTTTIVACTVGRISLFILLLMAIVNSEPVINLSHFSISTGLDRSINNWS